MTTVADLLSITPLSKVQVNSAPVLRDAMFSPSVARSIDLPFWFFQRVVDGMLEVRSPGGFAALVSPMDVCDIVHADPIIVQAIPRAIFIERLKLPLDERDGSVPLGAYKPAQVLYVTKDKWKRVDRVVVRFLDERYNDERSEWSAPVSSDTRHFLTTIARRDRLPVQDYASKASWSGVNRERPEDRVARSEIGRFFKSALPPRNALCVSAS